MTLCDSNRRPSWLLQHRAPLQDVGRVSPVQACWRNRHKQVINIFFLYLFLLFLKPKLALVRALPITRKNTISITTSLSSLQLSSTTPFPLPTSIQPSLPSLPTPSPTFLLTTLSPQSISPELNKTNTKQSNSPTLSITSDSTTNLSTNSILVNQSLNWSELYENYMKTIKEYIPEIVPSIATTSSHSSLATDTTNLSMPSSLTTDNATLPVPASPPLLVNPFPVNTSSVDTDASIDAPLRQARLYAQEALLASQLNENVTVKGSVNNDDHTTEELNLDSLGWGDKRLHQELVLNRRLAGDDIVNALDRDLHELPRYELKKRLHSLVGRMDTDENGMVELEELRDWIYKSFVNLNKAEAEQTLKKVDANGDNRVSWPEELHFSYGYSVDELRMAIKKRTKEMRKLARSVLDNLELFQLCDVNKDGFLDVNEYQALLHPKHYPHTVEREYKRFMSQRDTNRDGFIQLKEISIKDLTKPNVLADEKKRFKKIDVNEDGHLSKFEIIRWAMPGLDYAADHFAEELFMASNENNDNHLTLQEIYNNYEDWIDSHATNFGEHIQKPDHEEL